MNSRTGSLLSALFLSTALLAEVAAPRPIRAHRSSIHTIPTQELALTLQDENLLPRYAKKAFIEPILFALEETILPHFVITKSYSYPIRHLFIPYIDFKIPNPVLNKCLKYSLAKQSSFQFHWTPQYIPLWHHDTDLSQSQPLAFLEKTLSHTSELQHPFQEYAVTQLFSSEIQNFAIDRNITFNFSYPTYKKPSAPFRFCSSSIRLLPNNQPSVPQIEGNQNPRPINPNYEISTATPTESSFPEIPIVVRLPKSPISHSAHPIAFSDMAYDSSPHTEPTVKLFPRQLPLAITYGKFITPLQDERFAFAIPHMQPEKTSSFTFTQNDHFLNVIYCPSFAPALAIEPSIAHQDASSMQRDLFPQRFPQYTFAKSHPTIAAPTIERRFLQIPADAPLDPSPTAIIQSSSLTSHQIMEITPLVLDIIPLTIILPTLADAGFTLKTDNFTPHPTALHPDQFPKYKRSLVHLDALIEMQDMPLSHLVKSTKPLFSSGYTRPRSIEPDNLEWINQDIHLPSLIHGSTPSQIPSFIVNSAPDPRTLYCYQDTKHQIPSKSLDFQSQLIDTIELPVNQTPTSPKSKTTLFLPSMEVYAVNVISEGHYTCLQPGETKATKLPQHMHNRLDFFHTLITTKNPLLHPASAHGISGQLQATLVADASYKQQLAKKRLTPDQYIRKYGHFPTPEPGKLTLTDYTLPLLIHLDPIPDAAPHLWEDPSLVEDISSQTNFPERKHQRRSDGLNRKHRVTATNLARIPTLFDLETTSQNQDFSTNVSWLPKTTDGKYLFTITVKPLASFERLEQNIYFVIDNSTSINKGKATAYKSAIARALPYIHKNDHFNIFIVDDELHAMSATNLTVNASTKALTREYLERQKFFHPYKTSNVYAQLIKLSKTLENVPGLHTVYFFTDGAGLLDLNKHLSDVHSLITTNKSTFSIYPTCVGNDNHISFIQMLSTLQRGEVMHSPTMAPFPRKFAGFVKKHQMPIARDLHAIVMSSDERAHCRLFTEAPHLPTFYANRPLVIYGETDTLSDLNLMIQGRFGSSFVNVSKKISFDQNAQTTSAFRQAGARFQAASYFLEFLQTKDSEPLSKTNALLLRYGGRKLM